MYDTMMFDYVKKRHADLLKEAETERMIRKYQISSSNSFFGLSFMLNKLGEIMVKWGIYLQKRFAIIYCTQSSCKIKQHYSYK
jgi:hypothetical protein